MLVHVLAFASKTSTVVSTVPPLVLPPIAKMRVPLAAAMRPKRVVGMGWRFSQAAPTGFTAIRWTWLRGMPSFSPPRM